MPTSKPTACTSGLLLIALVCCAGFADPGQRPPPVRTDPGGLLHVEPTYYDLAAQTGGDFYFWAPGEFSTAKLQIPLPGEAVLLAYGRMDARERSFDIPVESGVRTLTIFAGAQRKDRAVVRRPDGALLAAGAPGVTLQTFSHMTIATITAPPPGTWRIEFQGAGLYSISAHVAQSEQDEVPTGWLFDFVEIAGRPGHEGWFPRRDELHKGESATCRLDWQDGTGAIQVGFVTADARPLATVPLDDEPGEAGQYLGRCTVPNVPFRVVISGQDRLGQPFRRTNPSLRSPR
jgi:hypothetical protein